MPDPCLHAVGLVLSLRERGERRAFICLAGSDWGTAGCVALGACLTLALARVLQLLPQPRGSLQRVQGIGNERAGGTPTSPYTGRHNFVVHVWVEKEFPDTQYLRRE